MTRAMLLCAGKGTRLGDISLEKPKPLLPVCDIPILRYGITSLVAQGITEIVINLHYQGDQIRNELGDGSDMGAHIQYSQEDVILGTAGGLKKALDLLDPEGTDEPILSMNGKLIFNIDTKALLTAFAKSPDSLGTMVVKPAPNAMKWGAVDVREEGEALRIHNILGEGSYMFCGVHVTRPSVLRNIPEGEACMVRQGYLPWIQEGKRVTAYVHKNGYFAEHSTPKRYLQSSIDLLQGAVLSAKPGQIVGIAPTANLDPSTIIVEPVRIAKGATLGKNTKIGPNVVIGKDATVADGSTLSNMILWPNSHYSGTGDHLIVTPNKVIAADGKDNVDN